MRWDRHNREGMNEKSTDGTAALDKALDVLEVIGNTPAGLTQAEIGQRLGLPRTTLYRLLGTLVARGLVRRDPLRRAYCIGMRCFEYARAAYSMPDLVAAAGAELRTLRDMSGETTYLAALDGHEVVALERCDGAHSQRSSSAIGQRKPVHCTSQGKAILAALPPERRDALVREITLTAVTPRSITDRRRLQTELRLTAQRGWSIDDEEIVPGVRCCGAAIIDADGEVRGAISVAGPAFRLTMERLELLGPEVAEAARRIGAQLSATQPARSEGEARLVPGEWAFDGAFPTGCGESVLWADRLAPTLHAADVAAGDRIVAAIDEPIHHLLPWRGGVALQAGDRWRGHSVDGSAIDAPPWPRRRFSAVTLAPDGTLWGCLADGERWRVAAISAEGQPLGGVRLAEPATALAWHRDGSTLFIAAAASGSLYAASAGSAAVRRLATVPKGSGRLAGLAVDAQGGLWTALRGGWSAARFEEDGSMERVVALPVPAPSGVGFGGARGEMLFVTSSRDGLDREALEAAPLSGRLFALRLG